MFSKTMRSLLIIFPIIFTIYINAMNPQTTDENEESELIRGKQRKLDTINQGNNFDQEQNNNEQHNDDSHNLTQNTYETRNSSKKQANIPLIFRQGEAAKLPSICQMKHYFIENFIGIFQCLEIDCSYSTDIMAEFCNHYNYIHGLNEIPCPVKECIAKCDIFFFPKHLEKHFSQGNNLQCYCSSFFKKRQHLLQHIVNKHSSTKRKFICKGCGKIHFSTSRIFNHVRECKKQILLNNGSKGQNEEEEEEEKQAENDSSIPVVNEEETQQLLKTIIAVLFEDQENNDQQNSEVWDLTGSHEDCNTQNIPDSILLDTIPNSGNIEIDLTEEIADEAENHSVKQQVEKQAKSPQANSTKHPTILEGDNYTLENCIIKFPCLEANCAYSTDSLIEFFDHYMQTHPFIGAPCPVEHCNANYEKCIAFLMHVQAHFPMGKIRRDIAYLLLTRCENL